MMLDYQSSSLMVLGMMRQRWVGSISTTHHTILVPLSFHLAKHCEYLYYSFHLFLTTISSLMAPGQVHAVVTMSGPQHQLTQGAIVYGSQFLSARCMLSSLLSSWVVHISQSRALTEFAWSETITTCLVDGIKGMERHHQMPPPAPC